MRPGGNPGVEPPYSRHDPSRARCSLVYGGDAGGLNFDEVASANLLRSLDLLFDGCSIDRECAAAIPDLRRTFFDLVAAADRQPLQLQLENGSRDVRGAEIAAAVYDALHDVKAIAFLPRFIADVAAGRHDELRRYFAPAEGTPSVALGLRTSVWCSEEMPFEDVERVARHIAPAFGLGGLDERAASVELCRAWNVPPAEPIENEAVRSEVPALIFAGEFDPDTPPDWGRQLLESMPRAYYVEVRGQSHGAGLHPCGLAITQSFLRAPDAPPPVGCALQLRGPDFGASTRRTPAGRSAGSSKSVDFTGRTREASRLDSAQTER